VLLGLTTDQKLGLAGTAAVFIAFALVSALLIPRYRPDFPGRKGLGLFLVLTILLTVGMLGAVVVFAKEDEATAGEHGTPTQTEPAETETGPAPTTTAEEPAGDPAAGEEVFASSGCGSCHTFEAAGTSGTVGPNLDETLADKDPEYIRQAIVDPSAVVAEGYQPGVMPENYDEQLGDEELANLVAFLNSS
jgi:mono/diheme cytochrome c family protein